MLYDLDKFKNCIEEIKKEHGFKHYKDLAKFAGISPSLLSHARKGERFFSADTFYAFCKIFNKDPEYFRPDANYEPKTFKIGTVISQLMKDKEIPASKLASITGIENYDLYYIIVNEKEPTKTQIELIAKALDTEPILLLNNELRSKYLKLRSILEDFHLDEQAISATMSFVLSNMK